MNTTLRDPMNTGRPLRAGFIGVGTMGQGMVMNLRRNGFAVMFLARETAGGRTARERLSQAGATPTGDPAELARASDVVILCLPDSPTVESILTGPDGLKRYLRAGSIVLDCSTSHPASTRRLAEELAVGGVTLLDGPLTGSRAQADAGTLNVLGAGPLAAFEKARPVIDAYARMVGLMGPAGAGQLTKMVNQVCIAGLVQGLAEGMHFGAKAGLDMEAVIEVISKGAAGSWQMENRHKTMIAGKYDFGFAIDWMRKDLDIVLSEARRNGAKLPVTALVDQFYGDVQAMGGNRWDTSSLLARLERK